jgi:hypothetical protein
LNPDTLELLVEASFENVFEEYYIPSIVARCYSTLRLLVYTVNECKVLLFPKIRRRSSRHPTLKYILGDIDMSSMSYQSERILAI